MPVRGAVTPSEVLYRIGRPPDPLAWPPPARTGASHDRGRYDDPRGEFAVLYAAAQRRGSFVETLDRYRPSHALLQRLVAAGLEGPVPQTGEIPDSFFGRLMGYLRLDEGQQWLDLRLSAPETAVALSEDPVLAAQLPGLGYPVRATPGDFVGADRALTQAVARWAFDHGYQGIVYSSTHDASLDCWALFDTAQVTQAAPPTAVAPDDLDLVVVAKLFGLTISFGRRGST